MGAACADPILVDPTSAGSSVTIDFDPSECIIPCTVDVAISGSLEGAQTWLDLDEVFVTDFFDITLSGLGYVAEATISATLAFIVPDIFAVASGDGSFFTIFGFFSRGTLIWDQPGMADLGDGTTLAITFENSYEIGFGNSTTVSAYSHRVAKVPEPGTLALLGIGLLAIGIARRRPKYRAVA
jgi:hypothetical protein